MRKALVFLLLVMILVSGTAAGADTDVSSLTDDQLLKIYRQIRAEAAVRGLTLTDSLTLGEGRYIVGQDIPPGVYLITCISTGAEDLSRSFGALGGCAGWTGQSERYVLYRYLFIPGISFCCAG